LQYFSYSDNKEDEEEKDAWLCKETALGDFIIQD
jgi:hypothetical protein